MNQMNDKRNIQDSPSPDRFVQRDVSDLQMEFGRIQASLENLKETTVAKEDFANWKLDSLK